MSYRTDLDDELVIDDRTTSVVTNVGSKGLLPRDFAAEPFGSLGFAVPLDLPLIPRLEWRARIEEMDRTKTRLSDIAVSLGVKTLHQSTTKFCWANGPTQCVQILRVIQGHPYIPLSPASVACPITGFRNVGGWGTKALAYIVQHGIAPVSKWPANAIDKRYDNDDSRRARDAFKVTEWFDVEPRNFDALMTCLLLRIPCAVAYSWWGHLVCAVDPVAMPDGGFGARIWNSWGESWGTNGFAVLGEKKATPTECVAPRVVIAA